jgi:serine protease Do
MIRSLASALRPGLWALVSLSPALMLAQPTPAPAAPAPPAPPTAYEVFRTADGRSYLGVGVKEIDTERARALKLRDEYGVEVTSVEEESPASKAGLKTGDVVLEYNGQRVEGTEQFVRVVRETPVGRTAKLLINRGGGTLTLTATLAARKTKAPQAFRWDRFDMPEIQVPIPDVPMAMMSWRSATLGVVAESLESQLAAYFGVKEGVLVRSVVSGSTAEKAGFKAGDVILKVDDSKVTSPRDVTSAIRTARNNKKASVPVAVMREKKETTLTVPLPEEPAGLPKLPRSTAIRQLQMD